MTVAQNHDAYDKGETQSWAWPVYAFVAWLATILGYVARFRRIRHTQSFKPDWRDSWKDLRQSEWLRDQLIAQSVAQLLAGHPLQLDDTKISLTPPAACGGPCPRTPFEMNRRFIALAHWAADPEAIIRACLARISRDAHASTDAPTCAAAPHKLACRAEAQRRREHERVLTKARGPPPRPISQANSPYLSAAARLRTLPLARTARTSGGPTCHRSAASRRSGTSCGRGPVS